MFYSFVFSFAKCVIWIFNGRIRVTNKNKIPKGNYVLIAPHRTWFDMMYFGVVLLPKQFYFLAKKELFKNPILAWCLKKCNVEPVDRNNPGIAVVKNPIKVLRKTNLSVMVFPSGTRHSTKLKGGAAMIAKMAGVPLLPVVYQGPLTIKELLCRKKAHINFGNPIYIDKNEKLNDESQAKIEEKMKNAFKKLDNEIDPNYVYIDESKKR
ncbi:acyl-phosphate glycerol 3-phosphate acyltransferase [Fructilactobacillus lindneri]|uniref:Acyl-phosphate glycerol 3-phosphate acyltransferase n=1 Tax=Fructilactobacillus lindneri TaxID=53444 RepID=A0AB33BFC7_9LACO|nr:1-acyl-sn-glycerol-3-phosphate acyltransferase [Fructilactobacillus lindneri]ANZ58091.1 acyl-phosphate glycerol 3-phosphate acyltransferase [Fructilactobacillus lindneri]ANZ59412.1 acyl-phosphate glycerol 3-phosphate acyltransferase [Fructilactobacillus lindneri]POG98804.1 acyl-phosphate glycerol 3-phosphate acyltransferase [Fructilactobacillus lindneri]POH03077.1 acyl-phosphate glycerol 3-phosphate acyltransferase [Fructilactobacillus lindneri]POH04192.1 acyl-phosphate glycerol 3-phosphate